MQFLHIVVGSVTGTALKTARYIRDGLPEQFAVQLHEYPDLDEIVKEPEQTILFCVSNTGAGELPPRMRKVYVQLTEQKRDLSGHRYLLINFADSSYKKFGVSGRVLDNALRRCGALRFAQRLTIDALHEADPRQTCLEWSLQCLT